MQQKVYSKLIQWNSAAKDTDSDEQVAIKKVIYGQMATGLYAFTFMVIIGVSYIWKDNSCEKSFARSQAAKVFQWTWKRKAMLVLDERGKVWLMR